MKLLACALALLLFTGCATVTFRNGYAQPCPRGHAAQCERENLAVWP